MNDNDFGEVTKKKTVDDYTINLDELQKKMKSLSKGQDKTLAQAMQEAIDNYLPTKDIITHLGTSAAEVYTGLRTNWTEQEFYAFLEGFEAGAQEIVDGLNKI